ncbi:MAG TPA: hypothetical protein VGJ14_15010 [Sporichthyaceae bacterium]|jgi:plasmid stability protein
MKTTMDLPADLVRRLKIKAAEDNRRLKDLVADLLHRALDEDRGPGPAPARVRLPLIHAAHPADSDHELTPERVAALLAAEEATALPSGER